MESFWAPLRFGDLPGPHVRQIKFEACRVRDLLRAFGLERSIPQLLDWYVEQWGECRLTFEAFHEMFATFPYMMEGQSFFNTAPEHNASARIGRWLTNFPGTFVYKRYEALLDRYDSFSTPGEVAFHRPVPEHQRGLPLAMVFPWQGVKHGLVLYNGTSPKADAFFSDALQRPSGKTVRVYVERYATWLQALVKSGWTPEGVVEDVSPSTRSPYEPPLMRAVILVCGGNARDAFVLSYLLWLTGPFAGPAEQPYVTAIDGVLHVAASHEQLAELTGLSVQQVRDAVAALCRRGSSRSRTLPRSVPVGEPTSASIGTSSWPRSSGWSRPSDKCVGGLDTAGVSNAP